MWSEMTMRKKSDQVRVQNEKSNSMRIHDEKERWGESSQ